MTSLQIRLYALRQTDTYRMPSSLGLLYIKAKLVWHRNCPKNLLRAFIHRG